MIDWLMPNGYHIYCVWSLRWPFPSTTTMRLYWNGSPFVSTDPLWDLVSFQRTFISIKKRSLFYSSSTRPSLHVSMFCSIVLTLTSILISLILFIPYWTRTGGMAMLEGLERLCMCCPVFFFLSAHHLYRHGQEPWRERFWSKLNHIITPANIWSWMIMR